ncbi:DNA polymerase [Corynebacterium guaraldiae]|uniref:DNA polymerase n=1 Tax=Corynebacterium guaraldiae TaxID=3051103 RepID=UPI0011850AC2|nr:DNA polymerase [Corynebacterium guaraldiae]TRX53612.1 DNA polymerase [Corynebacterium guaraldiae]
MRHLAIDLETYSPVNLAKAGVYPYAAHREFEVLLFGYSIDHQPPTVIDLAQGEAVPDEIAEALVDPGVVKEAHNAAFERVCLTTHLYRYYPHLLEEGVFLDPGQWRCTMVWAAYLGLPLALDDIAKVLSLPVVKDTRGRALIRHFCTPNTHGQRNLPESDPAGWNAFTAYNARDVEVETAIYARLAKHPVPEGEWVNYAVDQRINDRGILLDHTLVSSAVTIDTQHRESLLARATTLTGLENPNSPAQLKTWLTTNGCDIASPAKADVSTALETATGKVREVLELRGELSKPSVKKYQAMQCAAGADVRARGLIQFYGAGRTGRFAGRLIQVQNLPRNYLPDLDTARDLVRVGDGDALELLYPSVADKLSQLVRTAFIPSPGRRFVVADFNALEAGVIAWLAREHATLEAFRAGKDLYCETASRMFGVPVSKHGPNADLRQKGKIAVLACGYGGSVGALTAMGALTMGLQESELKPIVDAWRAVNPRIVMLWADIEHAAITAITTGRPVRLRNLRFTCEAGMLFIQLPSGRRLAYVKPGLGENRFGGTSITYWGLGTNRKWMQLETYGGKLTENIVQAIARDILTHAIRTLEHAVHEIVMHVHDEVIIDHPHDNPTTVEESCAVMATVPDWAEGLPLEADGFECDYYRKD